MTKVGRPVNLGLMVLGLGVAVPAPAADPAPAPRPASAASLRSVADQAAQNGRWEQALELYLRLYNSGQPPPEIRDRIRDCLRNITRLHRHRDPAFQQFVLSLKPAQALDLYAEVIERLSTLYADRSRCSPGRLFAFGLAELDRSLTDPSFRERHLEESSGFRVQRFQASLREEWSRRLPETVREARAAAFELSRGARDGVAVKSPSVVVLELICGACSGLDEFTLYVAPSGEQAALASPIAELAEYGLLVRPGMTGVVVDGVIPGSWAAHHTAISRGDRITRINGYSLVPANPAVLPAAMRSLSNMYGHELEVMGPDEELPRDVRLPVPIPSVYGADVIRPMEGVAYVRIAEIRESTPRELDDAVLSLKARGIRALILDARGNVGGNFLAGIQVAQRFLPAGIIVTTQGQSSEFASRVFSSDSGMSAIDLPVVLLVDARTMSAAEAIALAWKDHGRATLVGLPTFGKGTVQGQVRLTAADGPGARSGVLILTVAHMTGPRGQSVGSRVVPHILEADPNRQLDIAIEQAIDLAGGMR